jgi:hypothetical protein
VEIYFQPWKFLKNTKDQFHIHRFLHVMLHK